jgi:hypothetical protein
MGNTVRTTVLIAAAAITLTAACETAAVRRDLTDHYDPRPGRLCEVTLGTARNALPPGRTVLRYPEGMEEERLIVALCGGATDAELAFDDAGRVEQIIVSGAGLCLHGLCVGDRHREASQNPHVQPFFTAAEGGIVSLRRPDLGVGYSFDLERLPIECLHGRQPCSKVDHLKLDAIIVGRPVAN